MPRGIVNRLGEMVVFHHPLDVEVLDGDPVVGFDQPLRRLEMKVAAGSFQLEMSPGEFANGRTAVASTPFPTGNLALGGFQPSFGLGEKAGILDRRSVVEAGEGLNAQVNPAGLASDWEGRDGHAFTGEDHVPAIRFPLDRAGLDHPFYRAGEEDTNRADFGKMEFFPFQPKSRLWERERVEPISRLEPWEARLVSRFHPPEKGIEGFLNPAQCVLKHLAVNYPDIGPNCLDRRQLFALVGEANRNPVHSPGIAAFLNRRVRQFSTGIKPRL